MRYIESSFASFLATVRRDAGRWVARCTGRRDADALRTALAKRAVERELTAKGTPRKLARLLVAAQFRQRELNKEHSND